jgi:hypothetical protein
LLRGLETHPDRSSDKLVRLGLPFSPLFRYHREDKVAAETSAVPEPKGGIVKTQTYNSSFSSDWSYELFSWSAALVVVGIALLVASFLMRGNRPRHEEKVSRP